MVNRRIILTLSTVGKFCGKVLYTKFRLNVSYLPKQYFSSLTRSLFKRCYYTTRTLSIYSVVFESRLSLWLTYLSSCPQFSASLKTVLLVKLKATLKCLVFAFSLYLVRCIPSFLTAFKITVVRHCFPCLFKTVRSLPPKTLLRNVFEYQPWTVFPTKPFAHSLPNL